MSEENQKGLSIADIVFEYPDISRQNLLALVAIMQRYSAHGTQISFSGKALERFTHLNDDEATIALAIEYLFKLIEDGAYIDHYITYLAVIELLAKNKMPDLKTLINNHDEVSA